MSEKKKKYIDVFKDNLSKNINKSKTYKGYVESSVNKFFQMVRDYEEETHDENTVDRWRKWYKAIEKNLPQYDERTRDYTFIQDAKQIIAQGIDEGQDLDFMIRKVDDFGRLVKEYYSKYGEDSNYYNSMKWYRKIKPSLPLRPKAIFTDAEKKVMNTYIHEYYERVEFARQNKKNVFNETEKVIKTIDKWLQFKSEEYGDWIIEQMERIRDGYEPEYLVVKKKDFDFNDYSLSTFAPQLLKYISDMEDDGVINKNKSASELNGYEFIVKILDIIKEKEETERYEAIHKDIYGRIRYMCQRNSIFYDLS